MACTEQCKEKTAQQKREQEKWWAKWPEACPKCRGAGGKHHHGYFDYQSGVGEPPSFEPCSCMERGQCPRCGLNFAFPSDEEDLPCPSCGWQIDAADNQEPEPYECQCWYGEEMAAEDALTVPADLDWQQHTFEPD
jgi:hypothetical protein